jgi:hypothetical protein
LHPEPHRRHHLCLNRIRKTDQQQFSLRILSDKVAVGYSLPFVVFRPFVAPRSSYLLLTLNRLPCELVCSNNVFRKTEVLRHSKG